MCGYTFHIVNSRGKLEYITFVKSGETKAEDSVIEMLSACVSNMRQMHNDKYDKANFIKNMLAEAGISVSLARMQSVLNGKGSKKQEARSER